MSDLEPQYPEVLECLGDVELRATYGAVANVTGDHVLSVGARLGRRRPEASVSSRSGLPSGYVATELHPYLTSKTSIIRTGDELRRYLDVWKKKR